MSIRGRRHFLFAAAGLSGAALAAPKDSRRIADSIDLSDPAAALRAYVKLRGSAADETVFQPYEGDIFLAADGKAGLPLCGFKGLQKSAWRGDGQGGFTNVDYDLGFYVDYQTRAILHEWSNPLTERMVQVYHYRGGPSGGHFTVHGDAHDVYGSVSGRWSRFGDHIWHTSSIWGERPNPMTPEEWPLASSGTTVMGSMSLTFAGKITDVADRNIHQAPSLQVWTNTTAWMPWMEMGQRQGFNLWRWIGAKGVPRDALPTDLVTAVEAVWPGYVTADSGWQMPTSGRLDYMRAKKGLPLSR